MEKIADNDTGLSMWAVFNRPADFPDHVVARLSIVGNGVTRTTNQIIVAKTYVKVRRQLQRAGLTRIPRDEADVPSLVETWL